MRLPYLAARHPRALYVLALVQLWERFACFATLPLFVLYLEQHHGVHTETGVLLFGLLQALSYLSGLPGGQLADRWLGARHATGMGLGLLTLGYGALALDRPSLIEPALMLLVAGHGLFKPGFSTLVARLYSEGDSRRDSGFLLLHVVYNAGTVIAPLVAEWARARWGWAAIFQVAALAMLASITHFALGAFALRVSPRSATSGTSGDPVHTERERSRACWLLCGVGVVFWIAAVQASTSLTLFAAQHTEREFLFLGRSLSVAPGHFLSLHALLVLGLTPPLGWALSRLRRRGHDLSTPGKMAWGFVAISAAFAVMSLAGLREGDAGRVGPGWLAGCYVLLTIGELLVAPMGLALITCLGPPERTARRVALWCMATATGNALAGFAGSLWIRWPHHRYFALLALLSIGAASVLLARLSRLERLLARSASASSQPVGS